MKKITITLILVALNFWAFGQKTLPDTLINSEYIDVVRIKDTVYFISEWGRRKDVVDEINFSNGKNIYSYSSSYPALLSENGKLVLVFNYHKKTIGDFDDTKLIFDVYNKEGEIVKSYPFYNKNDNIVKLWGYHVFNNGNILIQISDKDCSYGCELYLYKKDSIIDMLSQITIEEYEKGYSKFHFFEEEQLILTEYTLRPIGLKNSLLIIYNYEGKLLDYYMTPSRIAVLSSLPTFSSIIINFKDYDKRENHEIIFDLKTKKYLK